jgi:hypothetical protein
MAGDYTRVTFNPIEDHLGVLMQQGRVLLDADFNELIDILSRRFRAESIDTVGRCIVPKETPDGFRIQFSGTTITIGRGRLYAHGLLAENHGTGPLEFDRILAEERGTLPIPYLKQPYLPNANVVSPLPTDGGPHLVYADVWQREVTFLEEADLVEKAVGVDSAARLQTVWQVKVLPNVGNITCSTPDDAIPGWNALNAPSAGRLTTSTAGVPAETDPCVVNPAGGFRGTENRLYRVEIHDPGPLGTATFKWSRDNASIATVVTAINAGRDVLTVARTGRDNATRFQPGDWVEVTDDFHEFAGTPGEMRKVLLVDDVSQTITLTAGLSAAGFDTTTPSSRHTRVLRWDQKGQVFDAANNVVADVDASNGAIPVPASGGLILEDGVQVEFSAAVAGGALHTGDYWVMAARTVDASIDILTAAPPKGIHHHFCRLALITFPDVVIDCRTLWPPDFGGGGCDCTVCVSAESHNNGTLTIQMAVDRVRATGGKICLGPGVFNLGATPVLIGSASSVQIQGHGFLTILAFAGTGPAIAVTSSRGIDITMLSVLAIVREQGAMALLVQNSALVRVERCLLFQLGSGNSAATAAVGLNGFLLESLFRDNVLLGFNGFLALSAGVDATTSLAAARRTTLTLDLRIEDNLIAATDKGISFENLTLLAGETRLAGNSHFGGRGGCVVATGLVFSDTLTTSRLDIVENTLLVSGPGVVCGVDNCRISGNDIGVLRSSNNPTPGSDGVRIVRGFTPAVDRLQILSNRITGVGGDGVSIQWPVASGLIKQNIIEGVAGGGVVTDERGSGNDLSIDNNQILGCGLRNDANTALSAIRASRVQQLSIAGNLIDRFAVGAVQNPARFGIEVVACPSARIEGNDVANIGPPSQFVKQGAGILIQSPFDRVDIGGNSVRRSTAAAVAADPSSWIAVQIAGAGFSATGALPPPGSLLFPFIVQIPAGFLAAGSTVLAVLPPGRLVVGVRGNVLETYGTSPAVSIAAGASCGFSDNECLLDQTPNAGAVVVALTVGAAIVNANHMRRVPSGDQFRALSLNTGTAPFTIVGNILMGGTGLVNGAVGIPAPWTALNVLNFS